jgi:hypothetical protein
VAVAGRQAGRQQVDIPHPTTMEEEVPLTYLSQCNNTFSLLTFLPLSAAAVVVAKEGV